MTRLQFRFHEAKAADAAAFLIDLAGGHMEFMRLIKLLYLADRESLSERGRPITGDRFCAMRHGPVMSGIYDILKGQQAGVAPSGPWTQRIARSGPDVRVLQSEPFGELSEADEDILATVHARCARFDLWTLVEKLHKHLPEWSDPGDSSRVILAEDVLRVLGYSDERIESIARETAARARLDAALAGHV